MQLHAKIHVRVSNVLFSLVARFVKYTGYGNAAGLLAQRGLMCGGRGAEYSSDSEDSETEEYSALQDKYMSGYIPMFYPFVCHFKLRFLFQFPTLHWLL